VARVSGPKFCSLKMNCVRIAKGTIPAARGKQKYSAFILTLLTKNP